MSACKHTTKKTMPSAEAGNMTAEEAVFSLIRYALRCHLIEESDRIYSANLLFDALRLSPAEFPADPCPAALPEANSAHRTGAASDAGDPSETEDGSELEQILGVLLDHAAATGLIEDGIASRDLFDTRLMGILTPRPSEVIARFWRAYRESPRQATDYFYRLAKDSDYIRRYRIRKDRKWTAETRYGTLDITINLSKPEKDPRAIAAALTQTQVHYPKCLLCRENEGYAGRLNHPARQNIRLIPLTLNGESWFLQYSPYVYYNEHCIVLSSHHTPMKIDRGTFSRLLEFVTLFPHYTLGSNADLPIVGGSILTHEHYQGGRYCFPMARAGIRTRLSFSDYPEIQAAILDWPMSVIRLCGADPQRITALADRILSCWRQYSDPEAGIFSHGDSEESAKNRRGEAHNTITPIARRNESTYELDLVLRNNRTTAEYPLGIFHPHETLHHIKRENIGLIEVMGLAILPARLLTEMELLKKTILDGTDIQTVPALSAHAPWAAELLQRHPEYRPEAISRAPADPAILSHVIRQEIGLVFSEVLEHAGVFKADAAGQQQFLRFIDQINHDRS